MHKILNDDTPPNHRNSFVRRNADQTDYHLRNSATDLTLPRRTREFLKRSLNMAAQCFEANSQIKQTSGIVLKLSDGQWPWAMVTKQLFVQSDLRSAVRKYIFSDLRLAKFIGCQKTNFPCCHLLKGHVFKSEWLIRLQQDVNLSDVNK